MWGRSGPSPRSDGAVAARVRLPAALFIGLTLSGSACGRQVVPAPAAVGPQWIVDPSAPGPSLPPVGRSLFDFVVGREVPPPFPALLRVLEARLESRPGSPGLQVVLIPRGRSLQREAAQPDVFRYPRVVVAATADPGPGSEPEIALKDRLYLGYQERAAVLEVISYNEAAGRFEFQVVRDYRPGSPARLLYADRALCMTCHQNGAPIFSRPPWDETSANPFVAARLSEHGSSYQGLPVASGIDVPSRLDAATDRANRLSVVQLLWREGCGGDDEPARRCRGDLLTLALARALSGAPLMDPEAYRRRVRSRLVEQGRARWPRGLWVPSPDLPNRDPLQADVVAPSDPLLPRPPLETWTEPGGSEEGLVRWLSGLADFFTPSDLRRLDAVLAERRGTSWSAAAACRLTGSRRAASGPRISFECASGEGHEEAAFTGRIYVDRTHVRGGSIDGIAIDGRDELPALNVRRGTIRRVGDAWRLELDLVQAAGGLRPRRPDGRALDTLALVWPSAPAAPDGLAPRDGQPWPATASLAGRDDSEPIRSAVTAIVRRHGPDGEALGSGPFRRAVVLAALERELGLPAVPRCCLDTAPLPSPTLDGMVPEQPHVAMAGTDPGFDRFRRYCGRCHETDARFPANFLYGPAQEQQRGLDRCAERIFFRLGMWGLPANERLKTPMPPVTALAGLSVDPGHWPQNPDLTALQRDVAERLRRRTGRPPVLAELAARGYAALPACLTPDTPDAGRSR